MVFINLPCFPVSIYLTWPHNLLHWDWNWTPRDNFGLKCHHNLVSSQRQLRGAYRGDGRTHFPIAVQVTARLSIEYYSSSRDWVIPMNINMVVWQLISHHHGNSHTTWDKNINFEEISKTGSNCTLPTLDSRSWTHYTSTRTDVSKRFTFWLGGPGRILYGLLWLQNYACHYTLFKLPEKKYM